MLQFFTHDEIRLLHRIDDPPPEDAQPVGPASPLGALVWAPSIRHRNNIAYLTCRAWRAQSKRADIAALKAEKLAKGPALLDAAADEIAGVLRSLYGSLSGWTIANIACGHSCDSECWGKLLARLVARKLAAPFAQLFEDRFVTGSSHPKENSKLPPLVWRRRPAGPVVIVDDVATSGWHLEEAASAIRATGNPAASLAWIGGVRV